MENGYYLVLIEKVCPLYNREFSSVESANLTLQVTCEKFRMLNNRIIGLGKDEEVENDSTIIHT